MSENTETAVRTKKNNFRKWLSKAESAFERASQIADILHKCAKEPTPFLVAKTTFDLANVAQAMFLLNYYEFFQGWSSPYSEDYNYAITEILKRIPYTERAVSDQNLSLRKVLLDVNGQEFELYYCINVEHESIEGIHVQNENLELAREFIKRAFWEKFGGEFLLMHKKKIVEHGREIGDFLVFDPDNDVFPHTSNLAANLAKKTKRFVEGGVSRSILLYGPPGTGKSTMVRAIVRELKMTSLRIRVEDLEDMSNATIFEAIKIFNPECIIIDDLDRIGRVGAILETLERLNKKLKLVFATVNDKDMLGAAVLRPGRFDEVIEISDMDPETVTKILGSEEDARVVELLRKWPVAYIIEYVKRRTYMSRVDALNDLAELHLRVTELDSGNYDTPAEAAAARAECEAMLKKISDLVDETGEKSTHAAFTIPKAPAKVKTRSTKRNLTKRTAMKAPTPPHVSKSKVSRKKK